jgi:capsular exopolysaccharide synthesis family protein
MEDDRDYSGAPRYSSLRDYLRVLRERWALILLSTLLVGAAAFAYTATQEKTYEARSTLSPRERAADIGLIGSSGAPPASPQSLTAELAAKAERDTIAKRVEKALKTDLSADQIAGKVTSSIEPQTNLVLIIASDSDPDFAAELANTYAEEVQREALASEREQIDDAITLVKRQLQDAKQGLPSDELTILQERLNRLETLKGISNPVEIVTAATAPGAPVSPKPARNIALGLLAGLFLGIILAFARDSLDTRLKTPREIEDHFGIPRVGQLTEAALGRSPHPAAGKRRLDPLDLEAARIIRTNLDALDRGDSVKTMVVTSPLPGEGKSTVAMALAWASAVAGKLTLLVECDLRRSVLGERLGLRATPGLTDAMLGRAQPRDVLQPVDLGVATNSPEEAADASRLVAITAGTPVPDPAEILASNRFAQFLGEVRDAYDLVVLDTSPLLSVVDTRELLQLVDGAVVCARSYQTTRDQARATREALESTSVGFTHLVVTGLKLRDDDYSGYYRRYVQGLPGAGSA